MPTGGRGWSVPDRSAITFRIQGRPQTGPDGSIRLSGNAVYGVNPYRGFESLSLRQIYCSIRDIRRSGGRLGGWAKGLWRPLWPNRSPNRRCGATILVMEKPVAAADFWGVGYPCARHLQTDVAEASPAR